MMRPHNIYYFEDNFCHEFDGRYEPELSSLLSNFRNRRLILNIGSFDPQYV
jgi:hypothetical protein